MNVTIWIRNPYPFRFEETQILTAALLHTYGVRATYLQEWPVHYVVLEGVSMTTAKQIALTLKFAHYLGRETDRRYGRVVSSEPIEVEVRGRLDGRPEWARLEEKEEV
jgi:hypothetical protein